MQGAQQQVHSHQQLDVWNLEVLQQLLQLEDLVQVQAIRVLRELAADDVRLVVEDFHVRERMAVLVAVELALGDALAEPGAEVGEHVPVQHAVAIARVVRVVDFAGPAVADEGEVGGNAHAGGARGGQARGGEAQGRQQAGHGAAGGPGPGGGAGGGGPPVHGPAPGGVAMRELTASAAGLNCPRPGGVTSSLPGLPSNRTRAVRLRPVLSFFSSFACYRGLVFTAEDDALSW